MSDSKAAEDIFPPKKDDQGTAPAQMKDGGVTLRRYLKGPEKIRKGDWIVYQDCKEPISKDMIGQTVDEAKADGPFPESWHIARWDKAPSLNTPEPDPVTNDRPAIWPLVVKDMEERDFTGYCKYGTRLQPHNGRDALKDCYQEILDAAVYMRQAIYERDGK